MLFIDKSKDHIKTNKEFNNIKGFYDSIFKGANKSDEIIRLYIANTASDDLFDDLKLEYLSTYLYSSAIDIDVLISIELLKSLISAILDPEQSDDFIKKGELSTKIYNSLSDFLKSEEAALDLDKILLNVIHNFGVSVIDQNDFVEILSEALLESRLCDPSINIQAYLKTNLLHLYNINYWDTKEEKIIYHCEIFILRRFLEIKAKNYCALNYISQNGLINVKVIPSEEVNDLYTIAIENNIIVGGNAYTKEKIIEYYDRINEHLLIEEEEVRKLILHYQEKVSEEFRNIIKNYLNLYLSQIFISLENYTIFECAISLSNQYIPYFIDSSKEVFNETIRKFAEDSSNLYGYLENANYFNLLEISKKYLEMYDEKYHAAIVWITIKKEAIIYFSNLWLNEYGMHLESENNDLSLDQLIELFCRCQDIPTKDVRTLMLFSYYLMSINVFQSCDNFIKCISAVVKKIENKASEIELELFEKKLKNNPEKIALTYNIMDIDLMDGQEFEEFISLLFTKMGYDTTITKGSGDQGLDVLAEKNGTRIGIQAKCYNSKVANKAVQEISAALKFYKCSKGIVITNNYFTDSAVELAESNNIILWDRDFLKRKIEELF